MNKFLIGAVIVGTVALAGCSSNGKHLDQLDTEVKVLSQKVDVLQQDVLSLKEETAEVKEEAARANQRLDNQVTTYRK